MPDRRYFEKTARDTGFRLDVLEKTYHLVKILQCISSKPTIRNNLTLKGGTALHFVYLNMPRLSIDIDCSLADTIADADVESTVKDIYAQIERAGLESGYRMGNAASSAIWSRRILRYQTLSGLMDSIKVEIDKIERVPLMPRVEKQILHPFPGEAAFSVYTHSLEELTAMKIKSLFDRAHPRDIYDLYKLSGAISDPTNLLRLVLVYSCFTLQGFGLRDLIGKVDSITEDSFTQEVVPFLRSSEDIDLLTVKSATMELLKRVYSAQGKKHEQFLNDFRAGKLRLDLLPPDLREKVKRHPSIQFWLRAR